jgi:hypothetical protein
LFFGFRRQAGQVILGSGMTENETQSQPPAAPALPEFPDWLCLGVLAALTLALFSDALFFRPGTVLSDPRMDLNFFFVHWRYFGFHELKSGNLALWNPHCAGGWPFFGDFQSALLYPLNFLYLLLPLGPAINWTIALHVFLGGAFTYYWVRHRGLHSLACLLSGVMFMLCGPHFLQVHAGHLPNLCTLIWAPLLFLAIDRVVDRPGLAPCLLGMFAAAMSVLAGHPQFVFYMGVAAGVYCVLQVARCRQRGRVIAGLGAIALGGAALSAVQLLTGLQEGGEEMRSIGMPYHLAASYSFPPENFLTLVAPWFLGDMKSVPYWGRWYLTETSLFVSVMGVVLAAYGMAHGRPATRRFSILMLAVVLVLAMGGYTPLFYLLYHFVPGFNLFRGMDKFLWLAALFLSALAGMGMDEMLRGSKAPRWLAAGVAGLGVVLCLLASLPGQLDWWAEVVRCVPASGDSTLLFSGFSNPGFIAASSANAVHSLLQGALALFVAASLLELAGTRRALAVGAMLLMAVVELTSFATASLATFQIVPPYSPAVTKFLAQNPGDYRIRHFNPNGAMTAGALDVDGDDPSGLLRYRRYLDFAEGFDFDTAPYGMSAQKYDTNAFKLLRNRYVFSYDDKVYSEFAGGLPHLLLADRFRVMTNFHEMFSTLTNSSFNMEEEVILESPPDPLPQPARTKGTAKLLASSTDWLEIEADTPTPALLLITDAYARGWRARALPRSAQSHYEVMPADYCLRAIPLAAGRHRLRVEYSPSGFRIGKWISIAAWAAFLVLTGLVLKHHLEAGAETAGRETPPAAKD